MTTHHLLLRWWPRWNITTADHFGQLDFFKLAAVSCHTWHGHRLVASTWGGHWDNTHPISKFHTVSPLTSSLLSSIAFLLFLASLSSFPCASTSCASTSVISRTLQYPTILSLTISAVFSRLPSAPAHAPCMSRLCFLWHFVHFELDWHSLARCPYLRQFQQSFSCRKTPFSFPSAETPAASKRLRPISPCTAPTQWALDLILPLASNAPLTAACL